MVPKITLRLSNHTEILTCKIPNQGKDKAIYFLKIVDV